MIYLFSLFSAEGAEQFPFWAPKGILHRLGSWETSPARKAAEQLEDLARASTTRLGRVPTSLQVQ